MAKQHEDIKGGESAAEAVEPWDDTPPPQQPHQNHDQGGGATDDTEKQVDANRQNAQQSTTQPRLGGLLLKTVTPGLKGTPFDRRPIPRHDPKRHVGWMPWCPLCMELQAWVKTSATVVKSHENPGGHS